MPLYRPTDLLQFLAKEGVSPKKSLSQNFLIDGNILRKIVKTADVKEEDVILEIGPGPGSLTEILLATGATIVAVEKDRTLAKALEQLPQPGQKLTIYSEDVLTTDLEAILRPHLKPGQKAKVIANLPYQLTTPILVKLVALQELFSSLTLMVQKEVAERIAAKPKTPAYGSLSLFLRFFTHPVHAFNVSRNCFFPVPKVESAIIHLTLHAPPLPEELIPSFFEMTRESYCHRRKMLASSLRKFYLQENILKALEAAKLNLKARPEDLSLDEFLELFKQLYPFRIEHIRHVIRGYPK